MKKVRVMFIQMMFVVTVLLLSGTAYGKEAEAFSFRNGITFGMSEEEVIQMEASKNQLDEDVWSETELGEWKLIGANYQASYGGYETSLVYLFYDECMQVAAYDFTEIETEEEYDILEEQISEEYGESIDVSSEDIVQKMDLIVEDFYHEMMYCGK